MICATVAGKKLKDVEYVIIQQLVIYVVKDIGKILVMVIFVKLAHLVYKDVLIVLIKIPA